MGNHLLAGRGPFFGGGHADTGVSVLAIVLRFTIWLLVLLAIVWVVREVLRTIRHHRTPMPPPMTPALAELEMLYARGEVSRTDYLARRADLSGAQPPVPPPS